jgi:hypothetical protein
MILDLYKGTIKSRLKTHLLLHTLQITGYDSAVLVHFHNKNHQWNDHIKSFFDIIQKKFKYFNCLPFLTTDNNTFFSNVIKKTFNYKSKFFNCLDICKEYLLYMGITDSITNQLNFTDLILNRIELNKPYFTSNYFILTQEFR